MKGQNEVGPNGKVEVDVDVDEQVERLVRWAMREDGDKHTRCFGPCSSQKQSVHNGRWQMFYFNSFRSDACQQSDPDRFTPGVETFPFPKATSSTHCERLSDGNLPSGRK